MEYEVYKELGDHHIRILADGFVTYAEAAEWRDSMPHAEFAIVRESVFNIGCDWNEA